MRAMICRKSQIPYFILTIGLFLCLIGSSLLSEGMFLDGVFYSNIAHKLSSGQCSFWHLIFNSSKDFYEHPPLAMGLQSLFLNIFGDNYLTDKFYSLFTYIVVALLICLIWKKLGNEYSTSWKPLLFWSFFPLVTWAATNNLLENTMSIFIVASVLFCLFDSHKYLFSILAGEMLFFAFLTKGPTAMFPLVFPLITFVLYRKNTLWHCLFRISVMLLAFAASMFLMFWFIPDSIFFFKQYNERQFLLSFQSTATVSSRFYILWKWLCEILPALLFLIIVFLLMFRKKTISTLKTFLHSSDKPKQSFAFAILGLCGVVPIMLSLKQRGFYIIPTFPFFAISLAIMFDIFFKDIKLKIKYKYLISCIIACLGISLTIINCGKCGRDEELISDMHKLETKIPSHEVVYITEELSSNSLLKVYFERFLDVSMSRQYNSNKFILTSQKEADLNFKHIAKYRKVSLNTKKYNIYEQIDYR